MASEEIDFKKFFEDNTDTAEEQQAPKKAKTSHKGNGIATAPSTSSAAVIAGPSGVEKKIENTKAGEKLKGLVAKMETNLAETKGKIDVAKNKLDSFERIQTTQEQALNHVKNFLDGAGDAATDNLISVIEKGVSASTRKYFNFYK